MSISLKKKIISFESHVSKLFNSAKIRAPVHLHNGNEEILIKIFKKIKKKMIGFFVVGDHIITVS